MRMTKIEIKALVFLLLCVIVVCIDDRYKINKVTSCYDAELDPLLWDGRASRLCLDTNLYHCLEDESGRGQMFEFCRDPVNIQPGYYPTYSDDVDRIIPKPCPHGYFQSRSVDSSDINRCEKWSICDELGQLVCKEGNTIEDTRCKCNHTAGYSILIYSGISSNKEICCPDSDTTCKCWEKNCPPGKKLNNVYQCVDIPLCGSGFYQPIGSDKCVPIATTRPTTSGDPATSTSTLKTTVTKTVSETTTVMTTVILEADDISKNVLVSACVGLFIVVVIALVVIWFCCPKVKAILFCIDVKEEEIDDELEPAKIFRCFLPCFDNQTHFNRVSSQDLKELENAEEVERLNHNGNHLDILNEESLRPKMAKISRMRRISTSLSNFREPTSAQDFRHRSNTLDNMDYTLESVTGTPHNYSCLNIQQYNALSPVSKATSIQTNKSVIRRTKYCCGCFGWEEVEPMPVSPTDQNQQTPFGKFSNVDGVSPTSGNGTCGSNVLSDSFKEFVGNTTLGDIPLIEVTGSRHSVAPPDNISDEVFTSESLEELTAVKEDAYKYENFPDLYKEKVHERIGIVTVSGNQGTGFRVGADCIMTTCDLFENSTGVINKIREHIITLIDTSQPPMEIEELKKCFKATLENHHQYSSRTQKITRLLDIWIKNNSPGFTFTDVAEIFTEIRPDITEGITNFVNQNWDAKIQFGFHREGESFSGQFDLDSKIPFYSDRDNIILLRLIRKPDFVIPPRFYLSIDSDIEVGMHLLGHPKNNSLTIDPLCHIYMGDNWKNDLKSDTNKAYNWCENNYDKWNTNNEKHTEKLHRLASQYDVLQKRDDMVFNCSRSILHNSAGCLGVVMNKSWPEIFKIQTMALTGHPKELRDYSKNFDPKRENVKLFYEMGITMKKVYRLLSNSKFIHLREDLFAKFEEVHKDIHKHIVYVQGDNSTVAVGDQTTIINKGQVGSEGQGQGQVSKNEGQSDIEKEEVSDSNMNNDSDVSGTNGDTEGNSDDSSGESFQGFLTNKNSKPETLKQTKMKTETKKERKQESNTPKKSNPSHQQNNSGHINSRIEPFEILIETLKEQGMRIRGSVPKDGNCFFHAVVDQLRRLDMSQKNLNHIQLRSQVLWYLKNSPEEQLTDVKKFVEGSWDEYLTKMERDGEYADQVIIEYTAKYLQREILIVTSSPGSKNAKRENIIINEEAAKNGPQLLLGHVYETHYESLEMKDETELEMDCEETADG